MTICSICAWRENCQKKFSVSGKDIRCADFTEDFALKKKAAAEARPDDQEDQQQPPPDKDTPKEG